MSTPRASLQSELESNRATFLKILDAITDVDLHRPSENPEWSVREILHHTVLSLEVLPRGVWVAQRNSPLLNVPQWLYDPLNILITRTGALGQTRASLRRRYEAAHVKALACLSSIPEGDWKKTAPYFYLKPTIEELFRRQAGHLAEHTTQLQQQFLSK